MWKRYMMVAGLMLCACKAEVAQSPAPENSALEKPAPKPVALIASLAITSEHTTLDGKVLDLHPHGLRSALNQALHDHDRTSIWLSIDPTLTYRDFTKAYRTVRDMGYTQIDVQPTVHPFSKSQTTASSESVDLTPERSYPLPNAEPERPLGISVGIGASGYIVAVNNAKLPPLPGCPIGGAAVCTQGDQYDERRLYNVMRRLKTGYPLTQNLVVIARPEMPFGTVARVLALLRYQLPSPESDGLWASKQKLMEAVPKEHPAKLEPMLPQIQFMSLEP